MEIEHLDRHVLEALPAHQQHDRHFQPAPAHNADQRSGLAFQPLLAPIDHQAADGGVGLHGDLGILDAGRADHLKAHALDGRDDFGDPHALKIFGLEGRRREQKRKALDEVHRTGFSGQIGVSAEEIATSSHFG
jgi:hypothetical protein